MNIVNAILIDDEQNNLDNISSLISKYCPQVKIIATANNAEEGKQAILKHYPDLVFLDIQMPGKTGFELLQELDNYDFEVIFITAFDQYAIQAIRFSAVDYLLKPVDPEELKKAVDRVVEKQSQKRQNLQLENLLQVLQNQKNTHRVALATLKEIRFVKPQDITHCEASNNYTFFYLNNGEKLTVSKPIYEYEELLSPYQFIRTHQSYLVNIQYIKSWVKEDGGYLLLETGQQIPVSRNKKEAVMDAIASRS